MKVRSGWLQSGSTTRLWVPPVIIARMRMRIVRDGLLRESAPGIQSKWWELQKVRDTVGGAVSYVNLCFQGTIGGFFLIKRFGYSMVYIGKTNLGSLITRTFIQFEMLLVIAAMWILRWYRGLWK